eukprot:scaffold31391_cov15-Tisochrysis_lutea.AAC.1
MAELGGRQCCHAHCPALAMHRPGLPRALAARVTSTPTRPQPGESEHKHRCGRKPGHQRCRLTCKQPARSVSWSGPTGRKGEA